MLLLLMVNASGMGLLGLGFRDVWPMILLAMSGIVLSVKRIGCLLRVSVSNLGRTAN